MSHAVRHTSQPLSERLVAHENARHARRIKEIRKLRARLRMMHPVIDALDNDHGIFIYPESISESQTEGSLYVNTPISDGDRLHQALLAMGFTERARHEYPGFSVTTVKKGRLSITVHFRSTSNVDCN